MDSKEIAIINFVKEKPEVSSKEIHDGISISMSYATTKRLLTNLLR